MNATQKTGFIKQTRREYIFSTKEPVQLFVNVTDSFRSPPTMIYDWYIDDKVLETHNVPRLVHEFNKTGRHTIKAVAKVNTEGYEDCNGLRYEKDPNGTFYVTVHMKGKVFYVRFQVWHIEFKILLLFLLISLKRHDMVSWFY